MRQYPNLLAAFYGSPWAILPEQLDTIEAVLLGRLAHNVDRPEAVEKLWGAYRLEDEDDPKPGKFVKVGSTALLALHGTITPRPSLFASGGTSAEAFGRQVDAAARDDSVKRIVVDVDSPGGSVFGIQEAAAKLRAAGEKKLTVAVANHVAASAAYWLGSQASQFYAAPGGQVGSVGVIFRHFDRSKATADAGVKVTTIRTAPHKDDANPYEPLSDDSKAELERQAGVYYEAFVSDVAAGRGVTRDKVISDFGRGRMVVAGEAAGRGMVDGVRSLEDVVADFATRDARARASAAATATADAALTLDARARRG